MRICITSDKPSRIATNICKLYITFFFILCESIHFPTAAQKRVHRNIIVQTHSCASVCRIHLFVHAFFYVLSLKFFFCSARLKFDSWWHATDGYFTQFAIQSHGKSWHLMMFGKLNQMKSENNVEQHRIKCLLRSNKSQVSYYFCVLPFLSILLPRVETLFSIHFSDAIRS